ncbi:MAG: retention module-containing protein, partial [Azonexus sp.]|nr:retention module-containing protein [Azonexus sp.]
MAEVVARVGKVTGEAFARDADGNLRRIKSGDPIREGEVVQAGAGGEVQLKLVDGRDLVVRANEAAKLDAEVAAPERPDAGDSAVLNNPSGFAKISKAIVGPDGTFSFDDDGGRGLNPGVQKEGHTFVELARIIELVDPLVFQFGTGRGQPLDEIRGGWIHAQAATILTFSPPETENISLSGNEDSPLRIDLKGSDPDGIVTGYVIRSLPANGLLYADAALTQQVSVGQTLLGPVFFKPDDNWNGKTSFQYASVDNTGSVDATPATTTIDIAPVNDLVRLAIPDTNGGGSGQSSVVEDATTTGSFTIGAPDGLDPAAALTIAGTAVSKAALEASGTTPVVITTAQGTLTITGYNPVTGAVSYVYDPSGTAKDHMAGEVIDTIGIVVRDSNGDTMSGTLNINILDTVPLAQPDTANITEDTASDTVGGNVITTGAGRDVLGADAVSVTAVSFGSAPQTVGSEFATAYGHLTLNADGSYSYRLDNTNAAVNALKTGNSLSETFNYTITDADGDPSSTTLTITINGTTDGGPSIVPVDGNGPSVTGQVSVLERGLTSAGDTSETTAGSITVGSPDGLTSVKIGGLTLTVAQLQALSGSPQVIDTGEGTLTLTGFNGTGSAPLGGDISYTYTLKAAVSQSGATESSDLIALEVTDRGGITTTGTLTVQIVDDTPTANADSNNVSEGTTSADSTIAGNVFSGSAPDVADRLGADTRANPVTAVSFGSAPQTVGSEFATAYGHLTLNADGSYSYRLDNTNAAVNALKTGNSLSETFNYTI